ncbi:permease [Cohnella nanjingensis]|uniref:Permease n=1 Tax=Cohnella nanjingensis TaxID=1387779 RepID=A0A7X0RQF9_9BACL|nr:permease [Cohnella nanjingensis]MBB6671778.1 permease [Cohnella nanjingensis]
MFAGHFGLAAAVKARSPKVPLWALMLSTQLLDVIFAPLYVSGIETIEPVEGAAGYGGGVIHADYTHALLSALLIAAVAGWFAGRRWGKRGGITIGAVVMSHWVLDLLVHRADLPILPGNWGDLPLLGFGLWQYPVVSAILEGLLIAVGLVLYVRSLYKEKRSPASSSRAIYAAGGAMGVLLVLSLVSDWLALG